MSLQRDSGLASRTDMAVLKAYIVSDSPILHVRVGRIEHVLTLFLPWRVFDGHRDIDIRLERQPTTLKVSLEREGEANLLSTQPFRSVPFQVEFQDTAEVPSSSYRLCCRFETEPRQGISCRAMETHITAEMNRGCRASTAPVRDVLATNWQYLQHIYEA